MQLPWGLGLQYMNLGDAIQSPNSRWEGKFRQGSKVGPPMKNEQLKMP